MACFRQVEKTGKELVITDRGRPVVKVVPYRLDPDEALCTLRGTVVRYDDPTEPSQNGTTPVSATGGDLRRGHGTQE